MLESKLRTGTSKKAIFFSIQTRIFFVLDVQVRSFSPEGWILYQLTVTCKRPILALQVLASMEINEHDTSKRLFPKALRQINHIKTAFYGIAAISTFTAIAMLVSITVQRLLIY